MGWSIVVGSKRPGKDERPPASRYQAVDRVLFVLLCGALVYWVAFVLFVLPLAVQGAPSDFTTYYAAAFALHQNAHATISDPAVLQQVMVQAGCQLAQNPVYLYPPLFAILLQPLVVLRCGPASVVWLTLNVALWLGSALFLARLLPSLWPDGLSPHKRCWLRYAVLILFLISVPLIDALILGQVNFLILLVLVLVPWLIQRDRPLLAGGLLAAIALLKIFAAFLLLYYLLRGRWRVLAGAALTSALLLGIMLLTVGLSSTLSAFAFLFLGGAGVDPPHNEALGQLPLWLMRGSGGQIAVVGSVLSSLLQWAVLLAFLAGMLAIRRPRAARQPGAQGTLPGGAALEMTLGYGWTICAMLLFSPLVWFHYNGWLLVPLLYGLSVALCCMPLRQRQTWWLLLLLLLAWLLTSVPVPFAVDDQGILARTPVVLGVPLWLVLLLTRPVGTLLLWGLLYRLWWRVSRANGLPAPPMPISEYSRAAPPRSAHRGDG